MQQLFITSTSSTMRMNVHLVRASQFFRQFCLVFRHKRGKKQIILDAVNWLTSTNNSDHALAKLELDALFVYYPTLVKIYLNLVFYILEDYIADNWWALVQLQIFKINKLV